MKPTSRLWCVVPSTNTAPAQPPLSASLSLVSPSNGAVIGTPGVATLMIIDNNINVGFVQSAYTVSEGAGAVTVNLVRVGNTM